MNSDNSDNSQNPHIPKNSQNYNYNYFDVSTLVDSRIRRLYILLDDFAVMDDILPVFVTRAHEILDWMEDEKPTFDVLLDDKEKLAFVRRVLDIVKDDQLLTAINPIRIVNRCVECGEDMGDSNPRQYCGKTRCLSF
jgi:hypothetical protein